MNVKNIKKVSLSIISLLLTCFSASSAFSNGFISQPNQAKEFRLPPRLYAWGFSGDKTLAEGQGLIPLFGDQNHVLYGVGKVNGVQGGSWLAGGGAGYRRVVNNHIYGGYLLADYNTTPHNNSFWILNPALEMLGTVWDSNINGYFPLNKRKSLGKEDWADNFGVYKYVYYTGHKEYDHRLKLFEEAGMGGSFEIGRTVPCFHKARLHLGGYYFDTKDAGSVTGASGRLVYEANRYVAVELEDAYDDENHNEFLAGLRFTLGGYSDQEKQDFGISSRLLDPIENNFAILAGDEGLVVPVKKKFVDEGILTNGKDQNGQPIPVPEADDFWFFEPSPQMSSNGEVQAVEDGIGTAEDPFIGFTAGNIEEVNPNLIPGEFPILMIGGAGIYNLAAAGFADGMWTVPNGWGIEGTEFKNGEFTGQPVTGENRPVFEGEFDIEEGSNTTSLDSINIDSNQISGYTSSLPVNFKRSALAPIDAALYVINAGTVDLQNVTLEKNVTGGSSDAAGIYVKNSTINFKDLRRVVGDQNSISVNNAGTGNSYGIYAEAQSREETNINFVSGINDITVKRTEGVQGNDYGIYAISSNVSNVTHSAAPPARVGKTSVNFQGGVNTVTVGDINTGVINVNKNGIYADAVNGGITNVNFTNGTNAINVIAHRIEFSNVSNRNFSGIYAISSDSATINVAFSGKSETTIAPSVNGDTGVYFNSGSNNSINGIYAASSSNGTANVTFSGGNTTISPSVSSYGGFYPGADFYFGSNNSINGIYAISSGSATTNVAFSSKSETTIAPSVNEGINFLSGNNNSINGIYAASSPDGTTNVTFSGNESATISPSVARFDEKYAAYFSYGSNNSMNGIYAASSTNGTTNIIFSGESTTISPSINGNTGARFSSSSNNSMNGIYASSTNGATNVTFSDGSTTISPSVSGHEGEGVTFYYGGNNSINGIYASSTNGATNITFSGGNATISPSIGGGANFNYGVNNTINGIYAASSTDGTSNVTFSGGNTIISPFVTDSGNGVHFYSGSGNSVNGIYAASSTNGGITNVTFSGESTTTIDMSKITKVEGFYNGISYSNNINGILAKAEVKNATKIQFSGSMPLLNIITDQNGSQAQEANGLYANDENVFVGIKDGARFSDFNNFSDYITFTGTPSGTAGLKARWWANFTDPNPLQIDW